MTCESSRYWRLRAAGRITFEKTIVEPGARRNTSATLAGLGQKPRTMLRCRGNVQKQ
jgi:hypothetical protein